ncbi:histidine phosphatase family protein [Alkaliphilus crotonatoxidans]
MKIYLTRHGETEWNQAKKMQGWKNSNLTEKGINNARRLGEHLNEVHFDHIYSSPLERTLETAKYIRGSRPMEIEVIEELKEMGFGVWEGMERSVIEEKYPEEYDHFWNHPEQYTPINGETFESLFQRVKKGLNKIVDRGGDQVLVVAHAVVIKAVFTIVKELPLEEFWHPPYMHDTCLSIIEAANDDLRFILEADISHLD